MIHFVIIGILVIISTRAIFLGLTSLELLPTQASEQAKVIDNLFDIHWFFISFFFSLIVVFMLYSFVIFRRKAGEKGDGDHFEGNVRLEVLWTVIPLIIVIGMAIIGADTLGQIELRDPGALEINVIGAQWDWKFEYPEAGITSTDLILPVNRQILLRLRSTDVIHSFWVPEFRVKQDALPGGDAFIRELRITPNTAGEYKVRCAELCGTGHATMTADVSVKTEAEYTAWVAEQVVLQTGECDLGAVGCGERWASLSCVGCHMLDGSELIAPSWIGLFGSTVPLDGGSTIVADEAYIRESILDPQAKIHEGFNPVMTTEITEGFTEQQIEDLIAFIKSLE